MPDFLTSSPGLNSSFAIVIVLPFSPDWRGVPVLVRDKELPGTFGLTLGGQQSYAAVADLRTSSREVPPKGIVQAVPLVSLSCIFESVTTSTEFNSN